MKAILGGPYSATFLIQTLICLNTFMIGCGSKNRHKVDTCLKEVKLHSQILLIILDSIVNNIEGTYICVCKYIDSFKESTHVQI